MPLDDYLPEFDVHEIHTRFIRAPREAVHTALKELRASEMSPVVALLFAIRALPALLFGRVSRQPAVVRPLLDDMVAGGFVLLADTPREIVVGLAGQPWKLIHPRMERVANARELQQLEDPTLARIVMNLSLETVPGGTMLATETRVRVPDVRSRRRFLRYWFCIRLGSGLIRILWLRAAARKAMAMTAATGSPAVTHGESRKQQELGPG